MGDIEGYDIDYRDLLGQGSYGSVYKARNKHTGEFAAVKRIIIPSHDFKGRLDSVRNEVKIVKELGDSHRNILKLFKSQEEEDGPRLYVQLVTEYCTLQDLDYYATKYYLTTGHKVNIMYEVSSGLAFMHSQDPPIIHRDVKPSNILMTEENGQHVVRLADFGLARPLDGSRSVETLSNMGTEVYMAPEQFDQSHLWTKSYVHFNKSGAQDAFSFGIVAYQLLECILLKGLECPQVTQAFIGKMMVQWYDKSLLSKMVTKKPEQCKPIVIKDSDSPTVKATKELIECVVQFDPRQRLSMADVETRLAGISKMSLMQVGLPVLIDDSFKDFLQCKRIPAMEKMVSHRLTFKLNISLQMENIMSYKTLFSTAWDSIQYGMGCSSKGVIMEDWYNNKLVLLSLAEAGYSPVWHKPRPDGVKPGSRMYILSDGNIVFRNDNDNVTVVCDGDLNPIHTHTSDYQLHGLCGVIQEDKLLYTKKSGDEYALNVFDCKSHQHVCRLPVSVKSDGISTSSHPATGWFVVTDWRGRTMYMFTSDYQLHMQVKLGFLTMWYYAVCCVDNVIAVVRGGLGISFYTWSGEEVKRVGREEMGPEHDIVGVGDGGEGRIQVFTADSYLHLYRI